MTRRDFLEAVGLALTGALAGFLTGRALVGEEVETSADPLRYLGEDCLVAFIDDKPSLVDPWPHGPGFKMEMDWDGRWYRVP